MEMQTFTDWSAALEEADFCVQHEGKSYMIVSLPMNMFGVCPLNSNLKPLEIIRPAGDKHWAEKRG